MNGGKSEQGLRETPNPWPGLKDQEVAPPDSGFAGRLRALIGDEPVERVAARCGFSGTMLRRYLNGAEPSLSRAAALAGAFDVSLDWLAHGRDAELRIESADARAALDSAPASVCVQLGRLGRDGAEPPLVETRPIRDDFALRGDLAVLLANGCGIDALAWLPVTGSGMAPTLHEGDIAVIRTGQPAELHHGHIYVVDWQTAARPLTLLRVLWQPDGHLALVSDNPSARSHDPRPLSPDEVARLKISGEVIWRAGRV